MNKKAKEQNPLLFISFTSLVIFSLLTSLLFGVDAVNYADRSLVKDMDGLRSEPLLSFFLFITGFGGSKMILTLLFFSIPILYFQKGKRAVLTLLAAVAGSGVSVYLLKELFRRPRPELAHYIEIGYAYPSAHAALSLVFYGVLFYLFFRRIGSRLLKFCGWAVAGTLIALVGASRIYLGVHYPGDVIGGYLLGAFWAFGAAAILESGEKEKSPRR